MYTIVDMNFSDWLLAQLNERNWSQSEFGRQTGLTRQAIGNYLSGRTPDEAALRKIARALKLPIELVFEKAGLLPPKSDLSPIKRKLAHLMEDMPDSDVEIAITLLEQRQEHYKRNPKARPAE